MSARWQSQFGQLRIDKQKRCSLHIIQNHELRNQNYARHCKLTIMTHLLDNYINPFTNRKPDNMLKIPTWVHHQHPDWQLIDRNDYIDIEQCWMCAPCTHPSRNKNVQLNFTLKHAFVVLELASDNTKYVTWIHLFFSLRRINGYIDNEHNWD